MTHHLFPIIAIVGRPNVGKSSLFNRLIQKRVAVTYEIAGTTRDNIYHRIELTDHLSGILVDTGGIEGAKKENIEADVQTQARLAVEEADIILLVVDASEDLTANDYAAADLLRKSSKPIIFIANKCDNTAVEESTHQFLELGFGEPLKISTIHRFGIDELHEALVKTVKKAGWKSNKTVKKGEDKNLEVVNISFIGRPNAGKSSLVNALLGKEKLIVSPIAGTTRDATDTAIEWKGQSFNLIDTAGLRRRGKIDQGIEKISSLRSLGAIERSDIVCLVLDFEKGIGKQDQHIASYVIEAKKGLILVVNKSDLMKTELTKTERTASAKHERGGGGFPDDEAYKKPGRSEANNLASERSEGEASGFPGAELNKKLVNRSELTKQEAQHQFLHAVSSKFDFLPWVPVLFVSALKKQNIEKILELAKHVYKERFKKIDADELDAFMKEVTYRHLPPKVFLTKPKIYALEQTDINPPTFVFWVNDGRAIHFSYRRYLENEIRKKYDFTGTAIRLIFKKQVSP